MVKEKDGYKVKSEKGKNLGGPLMAGRSDRYSSNKVRQGEIILRKPWMRVVFIGSLVLAALVALFFSYPGWGRFLD
jgi:hypothetical protein